VWLLVAALTSTFNLKMTSTTDAKKSEVIAMDYGKVQTTEEKSETIIEVAAASHAARTGLTT
jgi:predicted RecA/RadA family phage recombinase